MGQLVAEMLPTIFRSGFMNKQSSYTQPVEKNQSPRAIVINDCKHSRAPPQPITQTLPRHLDVAQAYPILRSQPRRRAAHVGSTSQHMYACLAETAVCDDDDEADGVRCELTIQLHGTFR